MKPLKIKKSNSLKKELIKIKGGGNTSSTPPPDDGNLSSPGQKRNAGNNLNNILQEED